MVLEVVLHVPVALQVSWANFARLTALYLAAAIPFFLTGLLFAVVFARETQPHPAALRRRPLRWSAGLPGGRSTAELGGRAQRRSASRALRWLPPAAIWARSQPVRRNAALLVARSAGSDWRELFRTADRRGVCQGHVSGSGMGGVRALECALARRSRPPRPSQSHRH